MRAPEERPPAFATFIPELKEVNVGKRQVTHLITNDSWDRAGDLIDEGGWDFDAYKKNSVVLADHRYSIFSIIGRSVGLDKGKEGIFSTTEFDTGTVGSEAFRLVQADLARAWSVGFRGLEAETIMSGVKGKCPICTKRMKQERERLGVDDNEPMWMWGLHYKAQELLEYSLVAIPMNADIVNNAVKDGLISKGHVPLFFYSLDVAIKSHDHEHVPEVVPPVPATPPSPEKGAAKPASNARVRRVDPGEAIFGALLDQQYKIRQRTQHTEIEAALRGINRR